MSWGDVSRLRAREREEARYVAWWETVLRYRMECAWCGRWVSRRGVTKTQFMRRDGLGYVPDACGRSECRWAMNTARKKRRVTTFRRLGMDLHTAAVFAVADNLSHGVATP